MTKQQPTWAVVATVDEPPALVQAFVAWHLALGASEMMLYFDRPDDPAAALFGHLDAVTVTCCDSAHWNRLGNRRPDKHEIRQVRNATHAYGRMQSDWLLHADADEYLWTAGSVSAALDHACPWTDCLVVPVAERVFADDPPAQTIFAGAFRRPARKGQQTDDELTLRGLTGHANGKAFTRRDRPVEVSIHRARGLKGGDLPTEAAQGLELLHFDGLTPLNWVYKLLRKADAVAYHNGMAASPHRQAQIDAVQADPGAALALHDRFKRPDFDRLRAKGLLAEPSFDPAVALQQYFPGDDIDLSPQAIDDWLRQEKQDVLGVLARGQ